MKALKNLLGGLAGATALNILHETVRRFEHNAPRVELVGEEALTKITKAMGGNPPTGNALYAATLAGDLVSNTLYYSLIGVGRKKHLLARGAAYGATAGLGALFLTGPLGLKDAPVTRTNTTKAMTVGYYLLGGLVTAIALKAIRK